MVYYKYGIGDNMKKHINTIYFYIFSIYIALVILFPAYTLCCEIGSIITLFGAIITLILNKTKLDKIDLFMFIIPLTYLITTLVGKSIMGWKANLFFIFYEIIMVLSLIAYKHIATKDNKNKLLNWIEVVGIVSFLIAIAAYRHRIFLVPGIVSHFGDTFPNSVMRMYGTLNYCNATGVFFLAVFLISLINKNKEDKELHKMSIFVSLTGLLFTISKMITIDLFIMIFVLTVYYLVLKKYDNLKKVYIELTSLIIPAITTMYIYRSYMVTYNFWMFFTKLILLFFLYLIINRIVTLISNKKGILLIPMLILIISPYVYFYNNPKGIPFKVNNTDFPIPETSTYLLDFDLDIGKHNITLDIENNTKMKPKFEIMCASLEHTYVDFYMVDLFEGTNEDFEIYEDGKVHHYYVLKITGVKKGTDYTIKHVYIDGKEKIINTFLLPYQYSINSINKSEQMNGGNQDYESFYTRQKYYEDSADYLKESGYIFGKGINTFSYYRSLVNSNPEEYKAVEAHSIVFELWLDIGIIGLFSIIFTYLYGIKYVILKHKIQSYVPWFLVFGSICIFSPVDLLFYIRGVRILALLAFMLITNKQETSKNINIDN